MWIRVAPMGKNWDAALERLHERAALVLSPCTALRPGSTLYHSLDHPWLGRDGCTLLSLTVGK